ncbi:hypothetical protein [Salisaeta longa]|uniref:hypothetical protein n=1 Tax=Salisaeta longa TaxID=503170 RepID=UPI0003B6CE04|nr:hypothetical protein [Salisaeta longa]
MIKTLFVILHIITAAAWFGLGLRLSSRVRDVLNQSGQAAKALAEDTGQTVRFMTLFAVLTLVFSYAAFFWAGGFTNPAYGPQYHAATSLIVVLVLVQWFAIRGGWQTIQAAVTTGAEGSLDGARKRVVIGTGVGHLLWLVLLVLMFWTPLMA